MTVRFTDRWAVASPLPANEHQPPSHAHPCGPAKPPGAAHLGHLVEADLHVVDLLRQPEPPQPVAAADLDGHSSGAPPLMHHSALVSRGGSKPTTPPAPPQWSGDLGVAVWQVLLCPGDRRLVPLPGHARPAGHRQRTAPQRTTQAQPSPRKPGFVSPPVSLDSDMCVNLDCLVMKCKMKTIKHRHKSVTRCPLKVKVCLLPHPPPSAAAGLPVGGGVAGGPVPIGSGTSRPTARSPSRGTPARSSAS